MNFNSMLFMIAMVSWSVGVTLLVIGWYGRRVDDHPICRRCRFDLYGLVLAAARKCPECGVDVSLPGRVLWGRRVKRKPVVGLAVIVIVVAAGLTAINLVPAVRQIKWIRMRPTAWLLTDVQANNTRQETTAVRELARRIKLGRLAGKNLDQIIARALSKQADRSISWQVPYGEVLDEALFSGQLDEVQIQRFFKGMFDPTLVVTDERIDAGDFTERTDDQHQLIFALDTGIMRFAYTMELGIGLQFVGDSIDGSDLIPADGREATSMFFMPFAGMASRMTIGRQKVVLAPGSYEIKSRWVSELRDIVTQADTKQTSALTLTSVEWEFTNVVTIEAVEADSR